jgi:hypothetical protein
VKYAWCPGDCGAKVGIREYNQVNFCCTTCWVEVWEIVEAGMDGVEIGDRRKFQHTDQCLKRQAERVREPVESGEFRIIAKTRRDKLDASVKADKD